MAVCFVSSTTVNTETSQESLSRAPQRPGGGDERGRAGGEEWAPRAGRWGGSMRPPYFSRTPPPPPRHPPEQRSLARIPDVPAPENPLEGSVAHRGAEHHVHGVAQ